MPNDPRDIVPRGDVPLPAELMESGRAYVEGARAEGTQKVYAVHIKLFERWCESNGRTPYPATPETLVGYLTFLADNGRTDRRNPNRPPGLSMSSIQLAVAAITRAHELRGFDTWTANKNRFVMEVLRGIRRKKGIRQVGKKPVMANVLARLIECTPSTRLGLRDRALLSIGFHGAFRRSEIVALDVEDVTEDARGLRVLVKRSKTDTEGRGAFVALPKSKNALICPVETLRAWRENAAIESGAVFRRVDRWANVGARLNAVQVLRTVRNALARLGTVDDELDEYGAHSLRAGLATSAAVAGKQTHRIMAQGRWASSQTLDRYIRGLDLFDENAADGLT